MKLKLKEAREMAEELNDIFRVHTPYPEELADGLVTLDNRITELEAEVKRLEGQLLELNALIQDVY